METKVKEIEQQETPTIMDDIEKVKLGGSAGYRFVKRILDVLISLVCSIVLLIPMIIIGILVRIDSQGPAIFKQTRLGKDEKPFVMYKFRTMKMDAPADRASRDFPNADQYITGLGAFLRRTSIDELPQLYNVLRGDMSIVGYRPVCMTETQLNALRSQYGVFATRPGITGLAQISGRDNISYEKKVQLDVKYVREASMRLDLWCMLKTVKTVFTGEGVM